MSTTVKRPPLAGWYSSTSLCHAAKPLHFSAVHTNSKASWSVLLANTSYTTVANSFTRSL
eukprot:6493742-Lingulodinium_polyedra.AAC.1